MSWLGQTLETIRAWTANQEPRDISKKVPPKAPPEFVIEMMICVFEEYQDSFGLSDEDFPDREPQERQCEFEDRFKMLICAYRGHDIGPDQCGKPEHDFCYRCQKLRTEIEAGK